jgi:hypothetical protein
MGGGLWTASNTRTIHPSPWPSPCQGEGSGAVRVDVWRERVLAGKNTNPAQPYTNPFRYRLRLGSENFSIA